MTTAASTRDRLLDAGERLFAEKGVANVSVAEITEAAAQKNGAAVHYHFGGRDGLLDAIIARHQEVLDADRLARLRHLDEQPAAPTLRELLRVIVEPMVDCLRTESGRAFLVIQAARAAGDDGVIAEPSAAMAELRHRIDELLPTLPADHRRERARLTSLIVGARLGQRADEEGRGIRRPSRRVLADVLVDAVEGVLAAPSHE